MLYEQIREIFNKCSGNQMRDVFVSEIESDNLDEYVRRYICGGGILVEKSRGAGGSVVYDIEIDGLKQRLAYTPL